VSKILLKLLADWYAVNGKGCKLMGIIKYKKCRDKKLEDVNKEESK